MSKLKQNFQRFIGDLVLSHAKELKLNVSKKLTTERVINIVDIIPNEGDPKHYRNPPKWEISTSIESWIKIKKSIEKESKRRREYEIEVLGNAPDLSEWLLKIVKSINTNIATTTEIK